MEDKDRAIPGRAGRAVQWQTDPGPLWIRASLWLLLPLRPGLVVSWVPGLEDLSRKPRRLRSVLYSL